MNALYSSTNRAENDGEVERFGLAPLMQDLITQSRDFMVSQVRDGFEFSRVASNKSTLLQLGKDVSDVVLVGEFLHITKHFVGSQVGQRVLDPVSGSVSAEKCQVRLVQACVGTSRGGAGDILGGDVAVQVDILAVTFFLDVVTGAVLNQHERSLSLGGS